MPPPKVCIVTPAPPASRAGNRNTALRWARILRRLGCRVAIETRWSGSPADLLVALHARKSQPSMADFRAHCPAHPLILALTGTDLYRDIAEDRAAAGALDLADRLIVLQEEALDQLTSAQRRKARVIHQSVETTLHHAPPTRFFRLCVLGHLREEKDPFLIAAALRLMAGEALEVVHAGGALSAGMARDANRHTREDPRYRWLGELPHWRAMRLLSRSHAMVISSLMEGGAHVVSEAIALGVPVIASDIAGNRGLLGKRYPALFPAGDPASLAVLIRRAMNEPGYLCRLGRAVRQQRDVVEPQAEERAWRDMLDELGLLPAALPKGPSSAK